MSEPHVSPHLPPLQTLPDGQVAPHVPQFALSVCVFAQYAAPPSPLHVVSEPHVSAHVPPAHTRPDAHAVPQLPQLALSVSTFVQSVPHIFSGAAQPELASTGAASRAASVPESAVFSDVPPHAAAKITLPAIAGSTFQRLFIVLLNRAEDETPHDGGGH